MATVNKDFKVKNGLVVEGTTGTINSYNILTESQDSQDFIIDIIGGETLITSVNSTQLEVVEGELSVKSGVFDAAGAASTAESNANDYTDTALEDYTPTTSLETTLDGYGYLKSDDLPTMYSDSDVDAHLSGTNGITYSSGTISANVGNGITTENINAVPHIVVDRTTVDAWYDAAGAAGGVATDLSTHEGLTSGVHGTTGSVVGTSDSQTLSNKTIDAELSFGTDGSSIEDSAGSLTVYAGDHLYLTSNGGDIVLDADGTVYIGSSSAGNEVATHAYVDATAQGLDVKASVKGARSSDLPLNGSYEEIPFDGGSSATVGDRILLTGQSTASENGIYVVVASDPFGYVLERAADAIPNDTLTKGAFTFVEGGTSAGKGFVVSAISGSGAITWTQFSETGNYITSVGSNLDVTGGNLTVDLSSKQDSLTAGTNIDITSNTISVTGLDTDDVSEGDNLYFTQARARESLSAGNAISYNNTSGEIAVDASQLDTDDISEGATNQYFTQTRARDSFSEGTGINISTGEISVDITAFDSDDISEGTTNQYFTDARAKSSAMDLLVNSQQSNISITEGAGGLLYIEAENGVDDSTTDDLAEGEDNLYFTNTRVIDAVDNADITPNSVQIDTFRKEVATHQVVASASTVDVHYLPAPYESAKYLVRVVGTVGGTKHSQISEILMTTDGNFNIAITEYGTIYTSESPLATFSAGANGPSLEATLTATTAVAGCEIIAAATMLSWDN